MIERAIFALFSLNYRLTHEFALKMSIKGRKPFFLSSLDPPILTFSLKSQDIISQAMKTDTKKKSHPDKARDQICLFTVMSRSASNGAPGKKRKC